MLLGASWCALEMPRLSANWSVAPANALRELRGIAVRCCTSQSQLRDAAHVLVLVPIEGRTLDE